MGGFLGRIRISLLSVERLYLRYLRHGPGQRSIAIRLDQALQRRPRSRLVRTRPGARFAVDTGDMIQRYLYLFGWWEPRLTAHVRSRLRPGDVFIDIGANIGYFSVLAAQRVGPTGRVVAVEAAPPIAEMLSRNLAINRCPNVRVIVAAVGDRAGEREFYLENAGNLGATTAHRPAAGYERSFRAATYPLTELVDPADLIRARLIKVDIEGGEDTVVGALAPLLPDLRDDVEIAIEISPALMPGDPDKAVEPLLSAGFHPYRLINEYPPQTYVGIPRLPALRWSGPITRQLDLVFSRIDAEQLP
jgi:FkbM family methyltransferase